MTTIDAQERELFEAWAMSSGQNDFCLDWTGNDPFDHGHTMDAWKVWQAARRARRPAGHAEPVAWIVNLHDGRRVGFCSAKEEANDTAAMYGNASKIVPLYAAPAAAEAVDAQLVRSIGDDADFRRLIRNCEHKSMGLFEHWNAREQLITWLDARLAPRVSASAAEAPDLAKLERYDPEAEGCMQNEKLGDYVLYEDVLELLDRLAAAEAARREMTAEELSEEVAEKLMASAPIIPAAAGSPPPTHMVRVPVEATPAIAFAIEDAIDSQLRASGIEPGKMFRQDGDRVWAAAVQTILGKET